MPVGHRQNSTALKTSQSIGDAQTRKIHAHASQRSDVTPLALAACPGLAFRLALVLALWLALWLPFGLPLGLGIFAHRFAEESQPSRSATLALMLAICVDMLRIALPSFWTSLLTCSMLMPTALVTASSSCAKLVWAPIDRAVHYIAHCNPLLKSHFDRQSCRLLPEPRKGAIVLCQLLGSNR